MIWVFPKIWDTPKWMVYNGKPYFLMDDLGGNPLFSETSISDILIFMRTEVPAPERFGFGVLGGRLPNRLPVFLSLVNHESNQLTFPCASIAIL